MSKAKNSEKKEISMDILIQLIEKSKEIEIYKKNENDFYIKMVK